MYRKSLNHINVNFLLHYENYTVYFYLQLAHVMDKYEIVKNVMVDFLSKTIPFP